MAQSTKTINKKLARPIKEKHSHFFLILFLILIVVAAVVYGVLILKPRGTKSAEDNQDNTSKTEQEDNKEDGKKPEEDQKTEEVKPESEKNNLQYEGKDPNSYENLTGIINFASISNGALTVHVSIGQAVSGTCDYSVTSPSGAVTNNTVNITLGPTSSSCSFTTPATEKGTYIISVTASSDNKRGSFTAEVNN